MRWLVLVFAVLEGCAPHLRYDSWLLLDVLPGPDAPGQALDDCDLEMRVDSQWNVTWPADCGRGDLPDFLVAEGVWAHARAYEPLGGDQVGRLWVTRHGAHAGLDELWVYDHLIHSDPQDFDAMAVLRMVKVR